MGIIEILLIALHAKGVLQIHTALAAMISKLMMDTGDPLTFQSTFFSASTKMHVRKKLLIFKPAIEEENLISVLMAIRVLFVLYV